MEVEFSQALDYLYGSNLSDFDENFKVDRKWYKDQLIKLWGCCESPSASRNLKKTKLVGNLLC